MGSLGSLSVEFGISICWKGRGGIGGEIWGNIFHSSASVQIGIHHSFRSLTTIRMHAE